jgi:hypothetical protein
MNLETRKPGVEIQDKELTDRSVTFLLPGFPVFLIIPAGKSPGVWNTSIPRNSK